MRPRRNQKPPENFEKTLEHARAGYANAQDIIKFIDTKIGVVMGVIMLSLGLPFLVIQWLAEQDADAYISLRAINEASPYLSMGSLSLLMFGFGAGISALVAALRGLLARSPAHKAGIAVLFPMFDHRVSMREAQRSLARLQRGLTPNEVMREYQLQLFRVGQILHEKAALLKRCVTFFLAQMVLYFFSLALLLLGKGY